MKVRSFHDLQVWQCSMQLAREIYALTRELPVEERYGLATQLRRAAVSIPSNIAEGSGYGPGGRNLHHVRIALGSDLEVQTQLILLATLKFASAERVQPVADRAVAVGKMLSALVRSLERRQKNSEL